MAVGVGRQACDRRGAAVDAAGRDRLAHAAADLASADDGMTKNVVMQWFDAVSGFLNRLDSGRLSPCSTTLRNYRTTPLS